MSVKKLVDLAWEKDLAEGRTTTKEGGVAYWSDLQEKVHNAMALGFIQNTFYRKDEEILKHVESVYSEALAKDPEFLAKDAVYNRRKGGVKFQPILALAYLSKLPKEQKYIFEWALPRILMTPKDANDFLTLLRKYRIQGRKGFGRSVRRVMGAWFNGVKSNNEEQFGFTTPYRGVSKYHVRRYSTKLAEVLKMVHATPESALAKQVAEYAVKGNLTFDEIVDLKTVLGTLEMGIIADDTLEIIARNQFQLEELKHAFGKLGSAQKQQIFRAFIPGWSYMALVQNLVNIERTFNGDVPSDIIDTVYRKLVDVEAYRRSRMLPFKLWTASKMTAVREWQGGLERVFQEAAYYPIELAPNEQVLLVLDTSGSMNSPVCLASEHVRDYGVRSKLSISAIEFGGLFAGTIYRSLGGQATVGAVSDNYKTVKPKSTNAFAVAHDLAYAIPRGWTCIDKIVTQGGFSGHDYTIIITDSEQAGDFYRVWKKAKKPRNAKVIVWQTTVTEGYRMGKSDDPNFIYIHGYSDKNVDVINKILSFGETQMDEINSIKITK